MIEEELSLRASDGKTIYYVRNRASSGTADKCIIIGHGLTGHVNEYLHQQAKFHFTKLGFDVVRIAFYSAPSDARKLHECTVAIHASDLNELIAEVKPSYDKVFYVGHSYGGLTALLANPDVDGVCFWDSTYLPAFWESESVFVPELDCYKIGWGVHSLASKAMVEEARALGNEEMLQLAKRFSSPACVILSGANQERVEGREKLFSDLPEPKERHVVDGADHCFNNGDTVFKLLEITGDWASKL